MKLLIAYLRVLAFFAHSGVMLSAMSLAILLKPGTEAYWPFAEVWIKGTLKIFGVTLRVTGREHLQGRAYVVMANHRSQLDPVAMGVAVLPRVTRWVAKKELRRVPVLGTALHLTGQIFIDRGDTSLAVHALANHVGDRDALICFFPEGHRSSTRQLLPFKKGAAAFAISSGLPVIPMAVSGSERCIPNHSIISTPGTIHVIIGEPIETRAMTENDRGELTETVRVRIRAMLDAVEGPAPASGVATAEAKSRPIAQAS